MPRALSPSDAILERLRDVCLAFPGTEEKISHGAPVFHVRGKLFAMFADDHHGDGRIAVWCKATPDEQRRRVAQDPRHFFVPPYVGVKGWVGVRLELPTADWVDLAILVEEGWASIAPRRIAEGPARAPGDRPKPPPRPTTDGDVARGALERLSDICLALPEATREREARHATFRVGKKVFAYFLDNHHGDAIIAACFKTASAGQQARLVASDPKRFYRPAYIGSRGWVGERLDLRRVDWKGLGERVASSYRAVAPRRLLASMDSRD